MTVGVVLAGAPVIALDAWIDRVTAGQSAGDAETFARRSINLAEARLGAALVTLNELASHGIDGCRPDQIETIKSASLSLAWVKQLAVLGPAGQPLCGDLNLPAGPVQVLAARPIKDDAGTLEVVQIGDRASRMVRLRRPSGPGANSISALLPSDLLVARLSMHKAEHGGYGQLALLDGTVIDEAGTRPADADALAMVGSNARVSERFGLRVATSYPQVDGFSPAGLREIALAMTGIFSLALVAFALILRWRQYDNPIAQFQEAIKAGEFVPFYQPTVDITNGRLLGAEVLMRWKRADGTIVPPAAFLPMAESTGLIIDMTRRMMRQVIVDIGDACALRPKLKFGFNMAAQHLSNETIVQDVRMIFEPSPIRYSQLVLEVTEREPLENLSRTRRVIAALQELGVRIAIDDVGTGHGGLSYILKLGADIIKIDKMFVDALGTDGHSTTIVETLVDMAKSLRMEIIAEGVETFEQVIALRDRGVRAAQGYVFAPPLPASAFLQLMEAIDPRPRQGLDLRPGPLRHVSMRRAVSA